MNKVKEPLRNWLFQKIRLITIVLAFPFVAYSQVANYVTNGGFELRYSCNQPDDIGKAIGWRSIDSVSYGNCLYFSTCYTTVPYTGTGFQYPRGGNSFSGADALCQPTMCSTSNSRGYLRNRLKANLQVGKTYCVRFHVNVTNYSSYGIDGYGAYFGDNTLDTITKINTPLIYLNPQIQNSNSNVITDTLNWSLITGTFTASGNEKHLVIGNFKSDAATTKTLINPPFGPNVYSVFFVDDVSCIDISLPAYAGPDIWCIPGNSVYIGRPSDVGIDEDCIWYKYPNMSTAIDTVAGLWVSPVITTTYIVKQDICGVIKYDTVVVHQSALGLMPFDFARGDALKVYPVPTKDELNLSLPVDHSFNKITITNNLGQLIREEEIEFKNNTAKIKTNDLPNGVYIFTLKDKTNFQVSKRFVIAR